MLQGFAVAVIGAALVLPSSCRPGDEAPDAVAKIADYVITKPDLKQRLAQEIRPQRDGYGLPKPTATPEAVLRKMVAEKAVIIEGRKLGYLDDEMLRSSIDRFRQRQLIQRFLTDYVMENVLVAEAEIDQAVTTDPNLSREQAEMGIRTKKARPALDTFYDELLVKFKLEKVEENFAKASQIHQRLLSRPATPRGRGVFWVMNKQIRNELSDQEKQIALARYTGGELTLYQWFDALGQMAPPGRPKDLNTSAGVERLLDRALKPVIWEAEAVARGYDQNAEFLQQVREREDMTVLGKARSEKYKELIEPDEGQIKAYFEAHPEAFAKPASLKVEQVWCPDLETAEKVKEMVTEGASFDSVNEAHGLTKNQPHNVYPGSEGAFWGDLWKGEPNEVVGPVKGFYEVGIKWRVVKILEKTPAEMRPYSDSVKNQVQSALSTQRREDLMAAYEAELLEKHRYEIYTDRITDIDPLEVTPVDGQDK
jgi:parvulin-like peptidyl-prolyl cis-trans isomerase-like protein